MFQCYDVAQSTELSQHSFSFGLHILVGHHAQIILCNRHRKRLHWKSQSSWSRQWSLERRLRCDVVRNWSRSDR